VNKLKRLRIVLGGVSEDKALAYALDFTIKGVSATGWLLSPPGGFSTLES
jgi:hypothetical protein